MIWLLAFLPILLTGVILAARRQNKKKQRKTQLLPVEIQGRNEGFSVSWQQAHGKIVVKQHMPTTRGYRRRRWRHRRAGRKTA